MGQSTIQNPHGTNRQIIHEIGPQYLARRGVSNVSSGRKAWGAGRHGIHSLLPGVLMPVRVIHNHVVNVHGLLGLVGAAGRRVSSGARVVRRRRARINLRRHGVGSARAGYAVLPHAVASPETTPHAAAAGPGHRIWP